ncbi:MAG: carbohydrate ABC transporter permease, partial [Pseudomonadota bacterium]
TIGLLVSSFRDRDAITASAWWKAPFAVEQNFAASAEGEFQQTPDGWLLEGNVFGADGSGEVTAFGGRRAEPTAFAPGMDAELVRGRMLQVQSNGDYRYLDPADEAPSRNPTIYFATEVPPTFSTDNYDTILTSAGMDVAFINTLTVTIPATIIPILIAAFAAYALAWMDFPFRGTIIAIIVGLLVVPLQLALVPMLTFHNNIGIGQSFYGIWFAHTGFGLPLAIYLLRNYMVGLPRDIIESAKVDGATDFQVFTKIVLPLSFPALASFAIFQFLWTWNDLLVAKVFLPSNSESWVMTVKIADDLLGSRGGDWGILAAAAFVSIAIPLLVFFTMQRYLVRGLLAGSVK